MERVYTIERYPKQAEIKITDEIIAERKRLKKHRETCLKNKKKRK